MCDTCIQMREHGIHVRAEIYRARRKPLNLAADSREIIGSEGKREREKEWESERMDEIHLGNFQYSHHRTLPAAAD